MSNLGYIIAAYVITLGALALYGLHLWSRLRSVERELSTLTANEGRLMAASNRRTRKLKLLIGAAVIAACVGYLVYGGIQETIVYFVTPSELHAKGTSAYGKSLATRRPGKRGKLDERTRHLVPYLRFGR